MFAKGKARSHGESDGAGQAANGLGVHLNHRIGQLDDEIRSIDEDIQKLQQLKASVVKERNQLRAQAQSQVGPSSSTSTPIASASGTDGQVTNYFTERFPWTGELLPRAQATWKIRGFRSVQEAVCNAALDGRDVVCVMPTGGGKSLCYQLPALISVGLTLVISPLISLSMDQTWHLREAGVPCEMMSSADSREESNDILRRIRMGGSGREEIKVLFVTPERVAKSKTLLSALQKCYEKDHLSRIVIDEAHCCSQMGHDFRPDYKKLSILRKIYPGVPILCLSATLAPRVLEDVRHILSLPRVVDPSKSPAEGTVYFTAPLHRPNLHYAVISRPSAAKEANQAIADWILANHKGQSGIVYTLSRADTQRMADALGELSEGQIQAAVYHAELDDEEKTSIHHRWRQGTIQVVVATIAFGMGIDKGDVRFVIHASLGKSLDSYYQETGRAGRDGNDSDCVLFYRPADAARVSGLLAGDPRGQQKLHSMLEYAQSTQCRKGIFGRYFQDRYGDEKACRACDNCLHRPEATDVTTEAWKLLRVLEEVYQEGGRITLAGLGDLARGLGGGQYTVVEANQTKRKRGKRGKGAKQSGFLDLGETVGEKVKLSKDDTERVLIELLLKGYIEDEYNATAYSVNVYSRPGPSSHRLTRHTLESVLAKHGCPTIVTYLESKAKKAERSATTPQSSAKKGKDGTREQRALPADDAAGTRATEPLALQASSSYQTPKRPKVDWYEEGEGEEGIKPTDSTSAFSMIGPNGTQVSRKHHLDPFKSPGWKGQTHEDIDEPMGSGTSRNEPIELDSD